MITLKYHYGTLYAGVEMASMVETYAEDLRNMGAVVCKREDLAEWWIEVHNALITNFLNGLNKRVKQVGEIEVLPVGEDVFEATKFYETEENLMFSILAFEVWTQWWSITR